MSNRRFTMLAALLAHPGCFHPGDADPVLSSDSSSSPTEAASSGEESSSSSPASTSEGDAPADSDGGPSGTSDDGVAPTSTAGETTTGAPTGCGDGEVQDDEECDDGDRIDGNGCNVDCRTSGQLLWTALDGDIDEDVGQDVSAGPDGHVYAIGTIFREGADEDVWITAYDRDGVVQWSELYDLSEGGYERGYAIAHWDSGGGSLFATAADANGFAHVLWVDAADGDLLSDGAHTMNLGSTAPEAMATGPQSIYWVGSGRPAGNPSQMLFALARLNGSGTGAQWSTTEARTTSGVVQLQGVAADFLDDVYVAGVDAGEGVMEKRSGDDGVVAWTTAGLPPLSSIAVAGNGEIVIAGRRFVGGQGDNVWLARYGADGQDELWSTDYNGAANQDDVAHAVVVDVHDDILLVGTTIEDEGYVAMVARHDGDGTEMWRRTMLVEDAGSEGVEIAVDGDGEVTIVGTYYPDDGDVFVAHLTP